MKTLISKMVMDVIRKTSEKQDDKGIKTYGKSLDEVNFYDYDWNVMALEELVDALKYQIVENHKLRWELANRKRGHYINSKDRFFLFSLLGMLINRKTIGSYIITGKDLETIERIFKELE